MRDQNSAVLTGVTVTWTTSANSVATVDAIGVVTAAGNGTATITATAGSASGSAVVRVTQTVASVEVLLSKTELTGWGETVQLTAEARDANGHAVADAAFSWESADALVAEVNTIGLVSGIGEGVATITASAGAASGSAMVTVPPTFNLSGTVRDSRRNGPALAGAVVRLENGKRESMVIGRNGRYRFPNVWGTVTVTAMAKPSYVAETIEVTVSADRTVDFLLKHTGTPPYQGTVFITPNLLGPTDPTSLQSVTYGGRGERVIYDRRPGAWITVNAYLFSVRYEGTDLEFQVNPEFGSREAAQTEVDTYAAALGRLPAVFLLRAEKVQINPGHKLFGGNWHDRSFLIHTDKGKEYIRNGQLEEVLIHEGAHVSLDGAHASSPGWRAAQTKDGVSISGYARDYPDREDIAESILPYFALRYRPNRLTDSDRAAILAAIPNRLAYFDEQGFDMSPYTQSEVDDDLSRLDHRPVDPNMLSITRAYLSTTSRGFPFTAIKGTDDSIPLYFNLEYTYRNSGALGSLPLEIEVHYEGDGFPFRYSKYDLHVPGTRDSRDRWFGLGSASQGPPGRYRGYAYMYGQKVAEASFEIDHELEATYIRGVVTGAVGKPLDDIGLWAWQGTRPKSGYGRTGEDGKFS